MCTFDGPFVLYFPLDLSVLLNSYSDVMLRKVQFCSSGVLSRIQYTFSFIFSRLLPCVHILVRRSLVVQNRVNFILKQANRHEPPLVSNGRLYRAPTEQNCNKAGPQAFWRMLYHNRHCFSETVLGLI
jgi:hypothetical protein